MITIAILCVLYNGSTDMQCTPFVNLSACLRAEKDLAIVYITESSCDDYEKWGMGK